MFKMLTKMSMLMINIMILFIPTYNVNNVYDETQMKIKVILMLILITIIIVIILFKDYINLIISIQIQIIIISSMGRKFIGYDF